jgi:hypothetical protein
MAPSYIALLGHSGSHAPQLIHSSVIMIAIVLFFIASKTVFLVENGQNHLKSDPKTSLTKHFSKIRIIQPTENDFCSK